MPLLKSPTGQVVSLSEAEAGSAIANGYEPVDVGNAGLGTPDKVDTGELGGVFAAGTGLLSGATLGLSDVVGSQFASPGQRDFVQQSREQHPLTTGTSQFVGALLPSIVAPESALARSPAGATSALGRSIVEHALPEDAGFATKAAVHAISAGAEGALYGGGDYLSQTALEDKPLSAEGFVAAMGHGALFGAPIGGVASLGESALMRASKLFPKSQVTAAAAKGIETEAHSALGQSVADGDEMAATAKRKIAQVDAQVGQAQAGEQVTRRMFGDSDPAAIGDQATGAASKQQLADALEKLETSKQQLGDWVRSEGDPDLEAALGGGFGDLGVTRDPTVPVGEFGAPGSGGFKSPEQLAQAATEPAVDAQLGAPSPEATRQIRGMAKGTPTEAPTSDVMRGLREGVASHVPEPFVKTERSAGGSQGGSWYRDPAGQEWFGKSYHGATDRVEGERLANQLYRTFGVDAPETQLAEIGGKRTMMSKEIKGKVAESADDLKGTNIKDGFVVDAWLGNRDVVGMSYDNIIVNGDKAHRIDNGGSTIWKATGGDKDFGREVSEIESMREPSRKSGAVFGGLSKPELNKQLVSFAETYEANKAHIDQLVDGSGLSGPAKAKIKKGLHERGEWLKAQADGISARDATPLTDEEFAAYGQAEQAKLDPESAELMRGYSRNGLYARINGPLRDKFGKPGGGGLKAIDDNLRPLVRQLDAAIAQSKLPRDAVLFRGASGIRSTAQLNKLKPGDSFVDPSFVSTSYDPKIGHDYSRGFDQRPGVEMKIVVPKDYPASPIPSEFPKERELVLGRNTKFTVTSVEIAEDGHRILYMTAEPADLAAADGSIPKGFSLDAVDDRGKKMFNDDVDIVRGGPLPDGDRYTAHDAKNAAYILKPSELASLGLIGEAPAEFKPWSDTADAPAVEILVHRGAYNPETKEVGAPKYSVKDSGQIMAAAAAGDKPMLVRVWPGVIKPKAEWVSLESAIGDAVKSAPTEVAATAAHYPPVSDLESLLRGTKDKLDAGSSIGKIGHDGAPWNDLGPTGKNYETSAMGADERALQGEQPTGLEGLIRAQREAAPPAPTFDDFRSFVDKHAPPVERIEHTSVLGKRIMAHGEPSIPVSAAEYEERLAVGKRPKNIGPDVGRAAKAINDYEEAMASMVEALGADAPPAAVEHAKAYREAMAVQSNASAASSAKAAADIDGKVKPALNSGTEVDDQIAKALRIHDARAQAKARPADATVVDSKATQAMRAQDSKSVPVAETPAAPSIGSRLADAGTAMEVLKALGVHVPALSAIPVIGPILGLYLKARAVMKIIGRKGGAIERSTEGIVAAKSAATRDRMSTATADLLTGAARKVGKASAAAGPAAILATKLFPGGPDPKSKDMRVLYEARSNEIARALQPGAIAHAIGDRIQTADPHLQDAITAQVERGIQFLDSKMPKQTVLPGVLPGDGVWKPSKAALEEWAKYVHAVNDPASVLEDLAKGHVTLEGAETLRVVYPALFAEAQQTLLQHAVEFQKTLPYPRRVMISIMFNVPIDGTMTPEHRQFLQPPPASTSMPISVPSTPTPTGPAIMGPLHLGQQTMTALDRRAGA